MDRSGREEQLEHFARVDHASRFLWQTEDPFVVRHEQAALAPLVDAIKKMASEHGTPLHILESGSGEGVNLVHLRLSGVNEEIARMEGVDVSPEAVAEAARHGLPVMLGEGLALSYPDESFDVTFCRDVLHHLTNDDERRRFFHEMRRVTKSDGLIVAIEPNPRNPWIFALSIFVSAERGLRRIPEEYVSSLFPGARVFRVAPSSVWRALYHYRSPLRWTRVTAALTRRILDIWDRMCLQGPSEMWSYRAYIWKK